MKETVDKKPALAAVNLGDVRRVQAAYDVPKVNAYLDAGWKLINITPGGTDLGPMTEYILGWYGSEPAPNPKGD